MWIKTNKITKQTNIKKNRQEKESMLINIIQINNN